jgi:hypothetical protein
MNKVIIQGKVIDTIDKKKFIYKVQSESLTGTMIYKVNSTKKLRKDDIVIFVGELIHNETYRGISEENGLIRDMRELVVEACVVEIKGFGTHFGGIDSEEDLENAFENHVKSEDLKINW